MRYNTENNFLTVAEVSNILKLSVLTIYKYIKSGSLEAVEFGGHYRIPQSFLEKFIENHKVANLRKESSYAPADAEALAGKKALDDKENEK